MAIDVAVIEVVGTEATPPKMLVLAVAGAANDPNREADETAAEGCDPNKLLPPNGDAIAGEAAAAAPLNMDVGESAVLVRANEEPPNMLALLAGGVATAGVTLGLQTFKPWNRLSVLSATIGDIGSTVKVVFVVVVEVFVFEIVVSDGVTIFSFFPAVFAAGVAFTDDISLPVVGLFTGNAPDKLNPLENGEGAAEDIAGNELITLVVKLL